MTCPVCGAKMVERVARTGARAGNHFWGCSRYPACRTIVDIGPPQGAEGPGPVRAPSTILRRTWSDYGRRGVWTSFYAPAGGRLRAWDPDLTPQLARSLSQAAFYLAGFAAQAAANDSTVVAVLRRALARGDRPPIDPIVEQALLESSGLAGAALPSRDPGDDARRLSVVADVPDPAAILRAASWREAFEFDDHARQLDGSSVLGSPREAEALRLLSGGESGSQGHWISPQASFASLLGDSRDARRADFLISHPAKAPWVLEIDGAPHHEGGEEVDRDRDQALGVAGLEVVRVSTAELASQHVGTRLESSIPSAASIPELRDLRLIWGAAVGHRISRALLEGVAGGAVAGPTWRVRLVEPLGVGVVAVRSALEIIQATAGVWGEDLAPQVVELQTLEGDVVMRRGDAGYAHEPASPDGRERPPADLEIRIEPFLGPWHQLPQAVACPTVVVRSASLPFNLREGRLEGGRQRRVPDVDAIPHVSLERLLHAWFAKREFYPADTPHPRGQEAAIRRMLGGRDTVVLLPTGAGKSLIYQLAGLLLPGRTLVIDPIVALIEDQLDGLARQGIDRAIGITGADTVAGTTEGKLRAVAEGDAYFCFVAPERLQQRAFRDAIRQLTVAAPINICAVDEAHCVSEWGHDFRTSYLDIGRVLREVTADTRGVAPPVLALTGTASRSVLRDLLIELDIDRSDPETIIAPENFDRPELSFDVVHAAEGEVVQRLIGTVRSLPQVYGVTEAEFFRPDGPDSYCGVVFTQTVNQGRTRPGTSVLDLRSRLARETGAQVGVYAGSRPKMFEGSDWEATRRRDARAYKDNVLTILVATKAYGMGIDKPNIRYTIHLGVPGSIEAYYQEAGRAGRDRRPARCLIIHDPQDRGFHDFIQGKNYVGVDGDVTSVRELIREIGVLGTRRTMFTPMSRDNDVADAQERAIHRLKLLGAVRDYLVDWGGARFELLLDSVDRAGVDAALIRYVRRTQPGRVPAFERELEDDDATELPERVLRNAQRLITFIYGTVVNARRRALEEMVTLAEQADGDEEIRERILRYLELGQVASELEALIDQEPFTFSGWQEAYARLDTLDDAREWRGATARYLESSPDHPGLLIGRALAEAVVPGGDLSVFLSNAQAAMAHAGERYLVGDQDRTDFLAWFLGWLHERRPAWAPFGYLLAERASGDEAPSQFQHAEGQALRDRRVWHVDELGVVLARRVERHAANVEDLASRMMELTR